MGFTAEQLWDVLNCKYENILRVFTSNIITDKRNKC